MKYHPFGEVLGAESQEQEHFWSPVIYRDFVLCYTVPLRDPSTPSPTRAYIVNMILNETTTLAISYGQTEFDTYLGILTVDQLFQQYINIHISL
jgi:hypothetical protein